MAPRSAQDDTAAGPERDRRLFVYSGGFLTEARVRRILALSGWRVTLGRPGPDDAVGLWGMSPTARRGETVAAARNVPVVRVEDAFLRSLFPGRRWPPLGLLIDEGGVHFDPAQPSDLETLLAMHPMDDTVLLDRARGAIARMQEAHLSKYSAFDPHAALPEPGYVLVVDQTFGDASVRASGADRNRFREMLFVAQEENPGAPILIKRHPATADGRRHGYFREEDKSGRVRILDTPVSTWALLEGAVGVYTVSSQLGFEAILAGHKPRLFGQPFYAGWGLTIDEVPVTRRQRRLTAAQLFAGAMILYPRWYDPFRDELCALETAIENFAAETRAWREDHSGWVASGMRLWKRKPIRRFFGTYGKLSFEDDPEKARSDGRPRMVWAGRATQAHAGAVRVEDGFLRSRGLGAELVPPVSLVTDDLGIYYDPARPSRLEALIAKRARLRPDQRQRAQRLIRALRAGGLSKYNLGGAVPALPDGPRLLVIGQVEDDASVRAGAGDIATNAGLIAAARAARPDMCLIYKPHPDVEAGLRPGTVTDPAADLVAGHSEIGSLTDAVDEVWTMTSLAGFEALWRGVRVVTTGAPFYAGWGLTEDRGDVPPRRRHDVTIEGLVHAALIDYPRYIDSRTGRPCPVEVAVERLSTGAVAHPGAFNRLLSKLQGLLAGRAELWR